MAVRIRPTNADSKLRQHYVPIAPARESDWSVCNGCGYAFARLERDASKIDSADFRRHKAECNPVIIWKSRGLKT